jgi:hypothetical protein
MTAIPHTTDPMTRQARDLLAHHASAGPGGIRRRLEELDGEWSVERVVEAKAAGLALVGAALTAVVDRRFAALPAVGGAILLAQAVFGGELFAPMGRPFGFRTCRQIDRERTALKALRGDFHDLSRGGTQAGTMRYDRAYEAAGR